MSISVFHSLPLPSTCKDHSTHSVIQSLSCQTGSHGHWRCMFMFKQASAPSEGNCLPKMEYLNNFPSKKLSIYATIIVIFTYNVLLEKDVDCTCKTQNTGCSLYMAVPPFIIFFLILWMDKTFKRIWKYTCSCCCQCSTCSCRLFGVLVRHMMKAALVGLLWVSSVFIDGDWYVCCQNDHSEQQAQLACKEKTNLTAEERTIIAELKNHSKIIGFPLLLCIIFVAALMSLFNWRRCCERPGCCDRRVLYDKLILEEEKNVVKEIWMTTAKERLTDEVKKKIDEQKWTECFDAVEEVMKEFTQRILSQQQPPPPGPPSPNCEEDDGGSSGEEGTSPLIKVCSICFI